METTQEIFEIYATVAELRARQRESDHEDWEDRYDDHGCFHSHAEDGEGDGTRYDVRRVWVRPAGSVPSLQSLSPESGSFWGYDEEEEEGRKEKT